MDVIKQVKRMKSIKERSEELEIEVYRTTRSKDVAEKCMWSYIKGAKYVLEEIESIMEDKDLDVEETYDKIYAMINQLKK